MGDSEYLSGFYNVELHHHLYGSVRKETIKDVARSRDIPFDETKFDEAIKNCHTLQVFVKIFDLFLPVIQGDTKVIERIAYEAVVDQYNNKVAYFETRFTPQLFLPTNAFTSLYDVIDAVIQGLERGERVYGVKSSIIFCAIRGRIGWLASLTDVLEHYKDHARVRGIDMAGNENLPWTPEELELAKSFYQRGRDLGYGCTFHAGEQGNCRNISKALDEIKTTRIGHGYAVFKDPELLKRCVSDRVHFEFCPISAETLGSLPVPFDSPENPIRLGLDKNLNFSLNSDDSLFFEYLEANIEMCCEVLGFTEQDLFTIRENAARAAFLPDEEKEALVRHILDRL